MAKTVSTIPTFRFNNLVFIYLVRLLRWTSFLLYGFAIGWINTHPLPTHSFAGNLKYLTYWNLLAQFALFSLINYCDIFLPNDHRSNASRANVLTKLRDLLHQGIAFPVGTFVALAFWSVYTVDPELIYPVRIRPYYPEWLNHLTHTLVGITPLIEEAVHYHARDNRKAFITLFMFLAAYVSGILYLGFVMNNWVYPVLQVLPYALKVPIILLFGLVFVAIYYFINILHGKLWPTRSRKKNKLS